MLDFRKSLIDSILRKVLKRREKRNPHFPACRPTLNSSFFRDRRVSAMPKFTNSG
jgi:hypothetical protein